MIGDVLNFLRDRLNRVLPRDASGGPAEDLFVFPGVGKDDTVSLKTDAVSILLMRIEEDATLRTPELYARISASGTTQKVAPEIRMHLYVLFVARSIDNYGQALRNLSRVISYFQKHRVFNHENSPDLQASLSQVMLELVTPSFSEQNEIWGTLRMAYQPSVLYKAKLIVFHDEDGQELPAVKDVIQTIARLPSS